MTRLLLICITLLSLLPVACSSSPEPASKTAGDQAKINKTAGDSLAAGDQGEPGPTVIVEPPEPEQTEPLATAVDESPDNQEPIRQPETEPEADWCPDCPAACIRYVALMEACLSKVSSTSGQDFKEVLQHTKDSFRQVDTPAAREALQKGCQSALSALQNNPACR